MTTQSPGSNLRWFDVNRAVQLDNETCVYCATVLASTICTKEHVTARRFVPKGKLGGEWNLIVNACQRCNGAKADLENDISAITLRPDAWGRFAHDDVEVMKDATRKSRHAVSRRTKKAVKDSHEEFSIKVPFGPGAMLTFNMTAPPQVDDGRVFELARLQLVAVFYSGLPTTSKPDGVATGSEAITR